MRCGCGCGRAALRCAACRTLRRRKSRSAACRQAITMGQTAPFTRSTELTGVFIKGPAYSPLALRALACCKPPCTNRGAQRPRDPDRGVRSGRSREACSGVLVGRGKKRLTTAAFALFTAEMWFSITELSSGECDHKSTRERRVELARQTAVVPGGGHGISPLTGSKPDVVDR